MNLLDRAQRAGPPELPAPGTPAPAEISGEAEQQLSRCLSALLRDDPLYASLAYRLHATEDRWRRTIASDGAHLRYNPWWVAAAGADKVKAALASIVIRLGLKHHTRREGRDPAIYQTSSQLVGNRVLRDGAFDLPGDTAVCEEDLSVEELYERIRDELDDAEQSAGAGEDPSADDTAPQNGSAGQGEEAAQDMPDDSDGAPGQEQGDAKTVESQQQGAGNATQNTGPDATEGQGAGGAPEGAGPDEGSAATSDTGQSEGAERNDDTGADDTQRPGEGSKQGPDDKPSPDASDDTPDVSFDPAQSGEIMDAERRKEIPGPEGADAQEAFDRDAEEQAWDEALHHAAMFASAEGKMPGAAKALIAGMHRAAPDFQRLLLRWMNSKVKNDVDWGRPNTRYLDAGIYIPSLSAPALGTLVLSIDSSSSLDNVALAVCWSIVRIGVRRLAIDELVILYVDTMVQRVDRFSTTRLPESITVPGRGGTDFRPAFEWVANERLRPDGLIYFTDLVGPAPERKPAYPVLWFCYSPEGSERKAPWGDQINIHPQEPRA